MINYYWHYQQAIGHIVTGIAEGFMVVLAIWLLLLVVVNVKALFGNKF